LDWTKVERLESKDHFNVALASGQIHSGLIEKKFQQRADIPDFSIADENSAVQVARSDVVTITPVEDRIWKQVTGFVDYGFSFTGGTPSTTQSSLSAEVAYRSEKWSILANGSSVFNGQSDGANTGRNTFYGQYTRSLTEKWFAGVLVQLLNSQQQDLTLRSAAGAGIGRILKRTDHTSLTLLSGLLFSRESYAPELGENVQASNAESLFQLRYSRFRFKTTQIDMEAYAYPNLTTPGRVRMGAQSALKVELFRNLFWKFSVYENFDSQPPVHAPRNDFGTSISFGWTY
jgi:hypothetical protein